MSDFIHFGEFGIYRDSIRRVEETVDCDGTPCVLVTYGVKGSILLYDQAAQEALDWFRNREEKPMPRPIEYARGQGTKTLPPPALTSKAREEKARVEKNRRESALRETVLDNIGRPDDLALVKCCELWDVNHYRVNVFRFIKGDSKMTDSFFVEITPDGVISSPPMNRRYYDDQLPLPSFDEIREDESD